MLSVVNKPIMPSVIVLNVMMPGYQLSRKYLSRLEMFAWDKHCQLNSKLNDEEKVLSGYSTLVQITFIQITCILVDKRFVISRRKYKYIFQAGFA